MGQFIFFIFGVIVGGVVVYIFMRWKFFAPVQSKESLIARQAREKAADKEAMVGLLETQGPMMNNHFEQMLGIPESTVTRYLDELEKEGKVRQVGTTGRQVRYERTAQQ